MANQIKTTFDSICLSSMLPETVLFTTDQPSLTVSVYVWHQKVFSSVYYPYNGTVWFHDLRSIIEAALEDLRENIADCSVSYGSNGSSDFTDEFTVVQSRYKVTEASSTFLVGTFLTTRKSAVIPNNREISLSYYNWAHQAGSYYYDIYYKTYYAQETVFSYRHTAARYSQDYATIYSNVYNRQTFADILHNAGVASNADVKYVFIQWGTRTFYIFFTDETPTDEFKFINNFGIEETAFLFAATTRKLTVNRSEAVIGRRTAYYDQEVSFKHEVETALLSHEEARWLSEMFYSRTVKRRVAYNSYDDVIISDITSEISNSDNEKIKLKFSWRYADGDIRFPEQ